MNRLLLMGTVAVAASLTLSSNAGAQVAAPAPIEIPAPLQAQPAAPPDHPTTAPSPKPNPQARLAEAKKLLDSVAEKSLNEDGQKKLSQLRDDFKLLMANYDARTAALASSKGAARIGSEELPDWVTKFDAVERDLTSILGAGSGLNPTSTTAVGTTVGAMTTGVPTANATPPATAPAGTPVETSPGTVTSGTVPGSAPGSLSAPPNANAAGTMSTSGAPAATGNPSSVDGSQAVGFGAVAISEIGVKNLDPTVRRQLDEMRRSVELFFDASNRSESGTP